MRPVILLMALLLVACGGAAPPVGTIAPMTSPPAADAPTTPPTRSFTTPTAPPVLQTARAAAWAATITATIARPTSPPMPPGPTPVRTPMPLPAKPTMALVPTQPAAGEARSSGLGRSRADWERASGPPDATGAYANGSLVAGFDRDRLVQLERIVRAGEPGTKEFMSGALAALLPADRVLIGPIVLGDSIRGERYRSAWLVATLYGTAAYPSEEGADFFVLYRMEATGGIASAIVATGDFP